MFEGAFWSVINTLLTEYGLLATLQIGQFGLIVYLFRTINRKELEKSDLTDKLFELSEKRLQEAKEEREDYGELARKLDNSIGLLVKIFRGQKID